MGPGFDSLALCHDFGFDRVTVQVSKDHESKIRIISESTPAIPEKNSAGRVALEFLNRYDISDSISIEINKGIPISSGLGGSGSSSAATLEALNSIYDLELSAEEKIALSGHGESASTEGIHYDNVAASLLGGLVIVRSDGKINAKRVKIHPDLRFLIALPLVQGIPSKTETMRKIIPDIVTRKSHVMNSSSLAFLISGLQSGDGELITLGMNDFIFEPERARLLQYYNAVRSDALDKGALGACISGAGPAMFFVCTDDHIEKVRKSIKERFQTLGILCEVKEVKESEGVRIEQ